MTVMKWHDHQKFVVDALKASVFAAPEDHGLTLAELEELGRTRDIRPGELRDALQLAIRERPAANGRYELGPAHAMEMALFLIGPLDDDPRNIDAFEFIWSVFHELNRDAGAGKGRITPAALLARGVAEGFTEHDLRVAVAAYLGYGVLRQTDDVLHGLGTSLGGGPKEQAAKATHAARSPNAGARALIEDVRDIILRRTDGRPPSREPIAAFVSALDDLGLTGLKAWWNSLAAELGKADEHASPTTVVVLAAALAEASLCAVMERVRVVGGTMSGQLWLREPKTWRFDELVKEAKRGQAPIFDGDLGTRATRLNDARQRIHAGRYWATARPKAGFDLRPEEAREARETLQRVLRAVLDWLATHPAPT